MTTKRPLLLSLLSIVIILPAVLGRRVTPNQKVDEAESGSFFNADGFVRRLQEQERKLLDHSGLDDSIFPKEPKDHLVTELPYFDNKEELVHYAGHLPASDGVDKALFYWMFLPPSNVPLDDDNIPLLIWLNGGPGCSSMDGLFVENGPLKLEHHDNEWSIQYNPYSWHTAPAFAVYVDQPVGTGLSFTAKKNYCKSDEEVNADFFHFMTSFLTLYSDFFLTPDKRKLRRPLYFTGESHAGHYIPSMMDYILKQNDAILHGQAPDKILIPLKGAAIGNGWIDPYYQYAAAEAAYGVGLINRAQKEYLDQKEKECQKNLSRGNFQSSVCFSLLDTIVDQAQGRKSRYKLNAYDIHKWELKGQARRFPPGHKVVENYLGGWTLQDESLPPMDTNIREKVLEAIHATASIDANQRYKECTDPPFEALAHQDGKGVVDEVVRILEHPTRPKLLFFNGVLDLMCNHVGNEVLLEKLPWKRHQKWVEAGRFAWQLNDNGDDPAGFVQEHENLIFLKILNAGHMVPLDLPGLSLEMIQNLMQGRSFQTSEQNLNHRVPSDGDDSSKTCPKCPTCENTSAANSSIGNDIVPPPRVEKLTASRPDALGWGVFALGLSALIMAVFVVRGRRQRERVHKSSFETSVEMEATSLYLDDPNGMKRGNRAFS